MIALALFLAVAFAATMNDTLTYEARDERSVKNLLKAIEGLNEANAVLRREKPSEKNEKNVLRARKAVEKAKDRACGNGHAALLTNFNGTLTEETIDHGCVTVKFDADSKRCNVTYFCVATTTFSKVVTDEEQEAAEN